MLGAGSTRVGVVDHVVVYPDPGRTGIAAVEFDGVRRIGETVHRIPVGALRDDDATGGFVTALAGTTVRGSPAPTDDRYRDRARAPRTCDRYGVPRCWL